MTDIISSQGRYSSVLFVRGLQLPYIVFHNNQTSHFD